MWARVSSGSLPPLPAAGSAPGCEPEKRGPAQGGREDASALVASGSCRALGWKPLPSPPGLAPPLSAGLATQCWRLREGTTEVPAFAVSLWEGSARLPVGREEVIAPADTCASRLPAGLLAGTCADINTT